MKIGILGGGISGLTAAMYLGKNSDMQVTILEKSHSVGGLCRTYENNGFKFDTGGHILFSKDKQVMDEMIGLLGGNVERRKRNAKVFYKGKWVKYPFENDLAALDPQDNFECLNGFINNPWSRKKPKDFKEWIYYTFGQGISEKFLIPYNEKIWKLDPRKLSIEWVGRIPKPPVEDVIKSALGISTEGLQHQLYYYYPKKGGYESLTNAIFKLLKKMPNIRIFGQSVLKNIARVNDKWLVVCESGKEYIFDELITTIPPHELIPTLKKIPKSVKSAVSHLKYNSLILTLLGFKGTIAPGILSFNIPDPNFLSHRICFPKSFSPKMAPPGFCSAVAEITTPFGSELWTKPDSFFVNHVTQWLDKSGIKDRKDAVVKEVVKIKYAYVVCDIGYQNNRQKYLEFLKNIGIMPLGRFGNFEYINSDVCFKNARDLAHEINI